MQTDSLVQGDSGSRSTLIKDSEQDDTNLEFTGCKYKNSYSCSDGGRPISLEDFSFVFHCSTLWMSLAQRNFIIGRHKVMHSPSLKYQANIGF
jgi:hypothetical protein